MTTDATGPNTKHTRHSTSYDMFNMHCMPVTAGSDRAPSHGGTQEDLNFRHQGIEWIPDW